MTTYNAYIGEYATDIPIIQRDYVQGSDAKAEKRDEFLRMILDGLMESTVAGGMSLDFIYGTAYVYSGHKAFIPIDGQQRLTTLALIGWLLAQKSEPEKYRMPELRYRTRHTTEQFCRCLSHYRLPENMCGSLRQHLMTEPIWMAERWLADPSVSAMVDLLESVDKMLAEPKYRNNIAEMAERFFTKNPISFYLLDMNHPMEQAPGLGKSAGKEKDFKLTEDLYVKMNARGKLLTQFENWKAQFTGMLETVYKDEPYAYASVDGKEMSIPEYFSYAIEHQWTDLLWALARDTWENLSEEKRKERLYPRIDEHFMALLDFCTEAMYLEEFQNEDEVRSEYEKLKKINSNLELSEIFAGDKNQWIGERRIETYRKKRNVETLFRMLDSLVMLSGGTGIKGLTPFFDAFLTHGRWNPTSEKVRISDEESSEKFSVNLVMMCLNSRYSESWTRQLKMLLWAILRYVVRYTDADTVQLQSYARTVWGWEQAQRQRVVKGMGVRFNIRLEDYPLFRDVVEALTTNPYVDSALEHLSADELKSLKLTAEDRKREYRNKGYGKALAVLGNSPYLKGDFSNIYESLDGYVGEDAAADYLTRFHEFVKLETTEKITELVKHGFKGIKTYPHTDKYTFYGSPGHWDFVFSSTDTDFHKAFTAWMRRVAPSRKSSDKTLEYYIRTYPQFMDTQVFGNDPGYYLYANRFPFEMTMMTGRYSARPMNGYNRCPYAATVISLLSEEVCERLKVADWGFGMSHGRIYLNGKYSLECTDEGWLWRNETKSVQWLRNWSARFDISDAGWEDMNGEFIFDGNCLLQTREDRIKTAVSFITALYRLLVKE